MESKELKESSAAALTNDVIMESKSDVPDFSLWDYNKICEYLQTKEQTPEICLAAVRSDGNKPIYGYALRYVKEQTPEICLAAVKQDGDELVHVKNQTPEICLAAVEQDGGTLVYVKKQTPEICLAAVQQNSDALQYVERHIMQSKEFQDQLKTIDC